MENYTTLVTGDSSKNFSAKSIIATMKKINFNYDIIEGTIVCHPDMLETIKQKYSDNIMDKIVNGLGIHSIYGPKIVTNDNIPKTEQKGWERTDILEDDKYTTWVENVNDAPSWAIFFGLVKPHMVSVAYYMKRQPTIFKNGEW